MAAQAGRIKFGLLRTWCRFLECHKKGECRRDGYGNGRPDRDHEPSNDFLPDLLGDRHFGKPASANDAQQQNRHCRAGIGENEGVNTRSKMAEADAHCRQERIPRCRGDAGAATQPVSASRVGDRSSPVPMPPIKSSPKRTIKGTQPQGTNEWSATVCARPASRRPFRRPDPPPRPRHPAEPLHPSGRSTRDHHQRRPWPLNERGASEHFLNSRDSRGQKHGRSGNKRGQCSSAPTASGVVISWL